MAPKKKSVRATAPQHNDLLAELENDPTVSVEVVDKVDAGDSFDPLQVLPEAPKSVTQRLDAQFSTKVGGKGYAVTLCGDYYAPSKEHSGKKIKKPYQVTVNIASLDSALSVIKHKLLDAAVQKKHEDFIKVRTHKIIAAVPLSAETAESNHLQYMSRERLCTYVRDYAVPLDPKHYPDVTVLRAAIVDYTLNPADFQKREAARQVERQQEAELAALNPDLALAE